MGNNKTQKFTAMLTALVFTLSLCICMPIEIYAATYDFTDNLTDYSKIYQSSTQYTSSGTVQEGDDTPLRLNNQPTTSIPTEDGWFLQCLATGYQPWLVYQFEKDIDSFYIRTLMTRRGNAYPTDFTFFVSSDNSTWSEVEATATKATSHTAGYFLWEYEASEITAGNKYLKIIFGDSSTQGTSAAAYSTILDTVNVNFKSDVSLTYNSLDFSDLSDEDSKYVTENLTLPTSGEGEATISWASSNENVLGADGTVDTSAMESHIEKITLTATISNADGTGTLEKTFDVVVVKDTSGATDNIFIDSFYSGASKIDTAKSTTLWPVGTSGTASGVDAAKDMKFANDGPTNYWYSDGWAINAVTLGAIPELVYSFERPFKSFFIDTFYCSRNSAWPTDFTFEVSENGTSWTAVSTENVTVDKATTVSPGGYYAWKFTVDELESKNNKYLKVIFGDNSATGQNFTIALDNVTVKLQTEVEQTHNNLDFSDLSGESIDAVTASLTLPTSGVGDTEISWQSSNTAVLSNSGSVNADALTGYREVVELTATISNADGSETMEKTFNVTVVKDTSGYEDSDFVAYDLASLEFSDLTDQPIDMLAADITLPEGVSVGSRFEWSISDSPAATLTENVLSFTPQNETETELTLTVTATYGSASDSKDFTITVVRGFSENLALGAAVSATSGSVNKALTRDVVTYWESEDSDNEKTVTVAFDAETEINSALMVEKGDNITNIEIKTSANGISYETVYSGESKGDLVREPVWFMPVSCKYVQFVFTAENPVKVATLELYNDTICDEQLIDYSLSELTLPEETSTNLTLPTEGSQIGTITWATSDASVITAEGVIKPAKYEHKSATLTATITYDTIVKEKSFTIKVPGTDVPQEPKTDVSFTFVDNLTDYSKIYQSSTQYTQSTPEQPGDDTPLRLNNQPTTSVPTADGWFLQPMRPGYSPWLVYKFDDPIYGFKADTLYTKRGAGGVYPTDFTFYLSPDGSTWTQVASEDITITKADTHTAGYYPWVFEASNLPAGNYYLKIVFGDSSGQGTSAAGFSMTLDTVTVSHLTAVSQAYNAFEFSDLSDQLIYEVTDDLSLPLTGIKDTTFTWTSSNPAVLSNTGVINTDEFIGYSIDVELTAKIEVLNPTDAVKAGEAQEKVYTVTVCRDVEGWTDSDFVNYDLTHLFLSSFTDQPAEHVATDIHLPTGFEGGSDFTWTVSESAAARLNGYVATFTPQYTLAAPVTLTVKSTHGNASDTKDFPITVVRAFADNLILGGSVSATSEGIRKALSRDVVTYWESSESDTEKTVTVEFSKETKINSGLVVEIGNNITAFKVEVSDNGETWKEAYAGTSNGNLVRRAYSFDDVECKFARITFTSANPVKIATLELYNSVVTESQALELSLEALSIPTSTSTDLTLPTTGAYLGTVTWTTSDANVITAEGKVSQALNRSQSATLTATLTYGTTTMTKEFTVTVTGKVQAGTTDSSSSSSSGGGGGGGGGTVAAKEFEQSLQQSTQQAAGGSSFADVPEDHWAYIYITELAKSGVISPAEYYRPADLVTREEFVKLIIAAIGGIRGEAQSKGFTDTDAAAWYYPYIVAAHDAGIVTGNADGTFGIGASITRQDAAAMLYRAIKDKAEQDSIMTFTDGGSVSVYAAEAVTYLANAGILNGYEDGSFRPFESLTRAESAKIIYMLSTLAKEDSDAK